MTPAEAYTRALNLKPYQTASEREYKAIIDGLLLSIEALTYEVVELRKEKEAA